MLLGSAAGIGAAPFSPRSGSCTPATPQVFQTIPHQPTGVSNSAKLWADMSPTLAGLRRFPASLGIARSMPNQHCDATGGPSATIEPLALFPFAGSMIFRTGRSAADGRLANPVRSGRKQPQRVSARVVCPASHRSHPHQGAAAAAEIAPHVRPVPGRHQPGRSPAATEGPGLFGDALPRAACTPRPTGCSRANTARPASTT